MVELVEDQEVVGGVPEPGDLVQHQIDDQFGLVFFGLRESLRDVLPESFNPHSDIFGFFILSADIFTDVDPFLGEVLVLN